MSHFCLATINFSGLKRSIRFDGEFPLTAYEFKSWILRNHFPQFQNSLLEEFYLLSGTSLKNDDDVICEGQTYHLLPRLVGGKGGFGSMLRAIGAQIEKTTNREACRDLSGRRMRDINNEKQLKDWMSKQKDREKERARRREEKAARRRAEPLHKFEDRLYDQQRKKVSEDLDDALQQGLKRAKSSTATSSSVTMATAKKRKVEDSLQKQWNWIGLTEDSSASMSSDGSDDYDVTGGARACPGLSPSLSRDEDSASASCSSLSSTMPDAASASCSNFPAPDSADIGASTSTGSDKFCPPHSREHARTVQDSPLESIPSNITEIIDSSSEISESCSEAKNMDTDKMEEKTLDLMTVLATANCSKDLECLGLENLKLALLEKGLKCGGTLAERAQRIFAIRGLSQDQIDPSFFAKSTKGKGIKKNKI